MHNIYACGHDLPDNDLRIFQSKITIEILNLGSWKLAFIKGMPHRSLFNEGSDMRLELRIHRTILKYRVSWRAITLHNFSCHLITCLCCRTKCVYSVISIYEHTYITIWILGVYMITSIIKNNLLTYIAPNHTVFQRFTLINKHTQ